METKVKRVLVDGVELPDSEWVARGMSVFFPNTVVGRRIKIMYEYVIEEGEVCVVVAVNEVNSAASRESKNGKT